MQPNEEGDLIYIKANYDEDETVMIAYDWKNKRQISHVNGTPAAEFIFDDEDECFVYDQLGIVKLLTGETFFEYHTVKEALKTNNLSRGKRMFNYGD